jgi:hypothetical protein
MTPEQYVLLWNLQKELTQKFEQTFNPDTLDELAEVENLLLSEFQSKGTALPSPIWSPQRNRSISAPTLPPLAEPWSITRTGSGCRTTSYVRKLPRF